MWMEGIVAPPDVDREIYRVALGGAGTEEPYWQGGDLHEYGAWWLIAQLERAHPGFVRRLLALAATRGDDDPRGLRLLARALGGRRALEAAFARFARTALDDPAGRQGAAGPPHRPARLGRPSRPARARRAARPAAVARADRGWRRDAPAHRRAAPRRRRAARLARARAAARGALRLGGRSGRAARPRDRRRRRRAGRPAHAHRVWVDFAPWVAKTPYLGDLHGGGCNLQKSAYARAVPAELRICGIDGSPCPRKG